MASDDANLCKYWQLEICIGFSTQLKTALPRKEKSNLSNIYAIQMFDQFFSMPILTV